MGELQGDETTGRDRWLGVELRHLAALAAVARTGSFSAAADGLGYVQSAVSQQLAYLERLVGTRLVERARGHGQVALTPAGTLLVEHIAEVLVQMRDAQAEMASLVERLDSTLSIGARHVAATRIVPAAVARLRRSCPGAEVVTREAAADDELLGLVAAGELDLAIADGPVGGDLACEELLADPYVVLVPAGWELAARSELRASELAGLPLIGREGCPAIAEIEARLRAFGVEPRRVVRSGIDATVLALVAAGVGVAIVSRLGAEGAPAGVATVALDEAIEPRRICQLWRRDHDPGPIEIELRAAARAVCEELRDAG